MINSIKKVLQILALLSFSVVLFAQETHPEIDIEQLEKEAQEQENQQNQQEEQNKEALSDDDLQTQFCIVETNRKHILNPHLTSYSADSQILTGLYEGLFTYNPVTLEPQWAIATDYKVSRDKKRIIFTIRDNAFFSNGEKITAFSVRDSWLQLLSEPDAPYSSLLDVIRGAQAYRTGKGNAEDVGIYAKSETELYVYLNSPANYLPKVLCHSSFSVVHKDSSVFSGPYKLYGENEGAIGLEKNPYYWDIQNTKIKYIFFIQSNLADQNSFLYNIGAAGWIDSEFNMEKILDKEAIQMATEFGTSYYFFKLSNNKPVKDTSFKPWDYAEFRNAVIEVLPWDVLRSSSIVPAKTFVYPLAGYPVVEGFDFTDPLEAKAKMANAKEKYGIPQEQRLTLTLEVSEGSTTTEKIEEALRIALDTIGVDLVVRQLPVYEYIANVKYSDADLFSYSWIGDFADPLAFLTLFQGDSTLNDSGWKNAEFDSLIEKAAVVSDSERYELLAQAETILLDSGMVMPVSHPVAFNVVDLKEVGGWSSNAFNIHPLKYLYKKQTKATVPNIVMNNLKN